MGEYILHRKDALLAEVIQYILNDNDSASPDDRYADLLMQAKRLAEALLEEAS